MKKLFVTLALALSFGLAHAIPLFPFFTDVAGDYEDGTPAHFQALNMPCMYWKKSSGWYKSLKEADEFLNDVMPYSSESISRTVVEMPADSKTKAVTYTSPMSDGKTSVIYLVEDPVNGFFIGYNEIGK